MSNPGVFFTVAYRQALPYLGDVFKCVIEQTRKDFDILIVNDDCERSAIEDCFKGLMVTILDTGGGFSTNRMQGINYARSKNYEYILFCDADDTFSANRYERTMVEFENTKADIVVSNLNIVDEHCKVLIKDYFSKEIPASRWIDAEFVKDKNIFGMSNTAIRLDALKDDLHIPETPIVDWYMYTMLLLQGLRARYITDSMVNYRQYNTNMIGINKFDAVSFKRLARLKNNHYRLLVESGYSQYQQYYLESAKLLNLNDDETEKIVKRELIIHPQPLWWQIIKGNNN